MAWWRSSAFDQINIDGTDALGCSLLDLGEKDAAKFKDYLLPASFLKRLSDV